MGVVTVTSSIITKRQASKSVPLSLSGAAVHAAVATLEMAAADSNNSIYRFCRVWSGCRLQHVWLRNDAITSATAVDFGLWDISDGAVVSQALFADDVSLASARTQPTDLLHYSLNIDKAEKRIWELLGLSADPQKEYDVAAIATAKGGGAGTLTLHCEWVNAV